MHNCFVKMDDHYERVTSNLMVRGPTVKCMVVSVEVVEHSVTDNFGYPGSGNAHEDPKIQITRLHHQLRCDED